MARFTTAGGGGDGTPGAAGPQGPAGNDGSQGPQGDPGADGLDALWNFTGEYNGGASYAVGDIATYDGQLWYRYNSNGGNVGDTPSPGLWNLLAAKGADGADGADGIDASGGVVYLGNYISGNGYIANIAVVRGSDNNIYIAKSNGGLGDPVGNTAEWDMFSDNTTSNTNLSAVNMDILPSADNTYTLGNSSYRWKSISVGDGTIYITDGVTGDEAALTIEDGVFFIDGIAQAQLPNIAVTNLTFADNTTQTTAAVAQVNSDWNATSGIAEILNKPDLSGYLSAPTPTSYNPVWSGTGLTYTGTPATGSYMKIGKMVTFRIKVLCSTVTNFGTGQYSLTLPFDPVDDYVFRDGGLHHVAQNYHYQISGDAESGTTELRMLYQGTNGKDEAFLHNNPHELQVSDYFYVSGTYESI